MKERKEIAIENAVLDMVGEIGHEGFALWCVLRIECPLGEWICTCSLEELSRKTGIEDKRDVLAFLKRLIKKGLIEVIKDGGLENQSTYLLKPPYYPTINDLVDPQFS